MLTRILKFLIFCTIHLCLDIIQVLRNFYSRLKIKCGDKKVKREDLELILRNLPNMNKKLTHVVLITNNGNHSLGNLALLVIWGLITGVPYISFYDVTGQLKKHEDDLFHEVEKHKIGVPGYIKWSNKPDLNGYSNGLQSHTIIVNIFTNDDGRLKIAQCIREIADKRLLNANEVSIQKLDEVISSVYRSIPEPDIALYTGPLCCSYGLLPWHIRLTEFIQLSVDNSISINDYLKALYKYNKCCQRYGK